MRSHQKTTPKVKGGKVQKKNRHTITPNYWNTRQDELQVDIEKPGKGFKHFLKKRDILKFLQILPNWEELNIEFDAILLSQGGGDAEAWYSDGVIVICAWEKEMTTTMNLPYYEAHKEILARLNVEIETKAKYVICYFTAHQIRAYQLLHILLHELGHHHDRVSTKDKVDNAPRGEDYAESYAFKYEKIIWNRFFEVFDMV